MVIRQPLRPDVAILLALAVAAGGAAFTAGFLQDRVTSIGKRRPVSLPDWLTHTDGDAPSPEPNARSVLTLETHTRSHQVGVAFSDELLNRLRLVNAQHKGRLWQSEPSAVVLADCAPADPEAGRTIRTLCRQLATAARVDSVTRWELANHVLAMVQREIAYALDSDSTVTMAGGPFEEYGRFALETLNDRVGDCECTSILCASLLAHLGYDTALVWVEVQDEPGRTSSHVVVGLSVELLPSGLVDGLVVASGPDGRTYLCGETAMDGATLAFGVLPHFIRYTARITGVQPIGRSPSA
jgi:hypothetical protein